MTLRRRLYIISAILLAVMILSQLFVTSSLFDNFYMENNWDRLGAAVWITVLVTVPAAVVAFVAFILAVIMSIRQKYVKKR